MKGSRLLEILGPARLAYFTPVAEYPSLGDRKALAVLAAQGLMTSVLLAFWDQLELGIRTAAPLVRASLVSGLAVFVATLVSSGRQAFLALMLPAPPMQPSMAFWGQVGRIDLEDYKGRIGELDHESALRHQLHFNHAVSVQSKVKFEMIEAALLRLRVGSLVWMLLMVALTLRPR